MQNPKCKKLLFYMTIKNICIISENYIRRKAKKQQQRRLKLLDRATEGNQGKFIIAKIDSWC